MTEYNFQDLHILKTVYAQVLLFHNLINNLTFVQ